MTKQDFNNCLNVIEGLLSRIKYPLNDATYKEYLTLMRAKLVIESKYLEGVFDD